MQSGEILGLLPDYEIRRLSVFPSGPPLLSPFAERIERDPDLNARVPSYGLSPAGYDLRLEANLQVYRKTGGPIDVRHFNVDHLEPARLYTESNELRYFVLPAGCSALAVALERIHMPVDLVATIWPKSTYARAMLHVANTIVEAGWAGHLVLELTNQAPDDVIIYPDAGVAQIQFTRLPPPDLDYSQLKGRYMNQAGITPPR